MSNRNCILPAAVTVLVFSLSTSQAATIRECQDFLKVGQYEECLAATSEAIERRSYGEDWPMLKAEAETRLGKYNDAIETVKAGTERYSWSIRLRMKWYELCRETGADKQAELLIGEINDLAVATPWRYTDADDLVALGRAALVLGADPKDVLEGFFDRARENYKTRPDGFLAAGRLAIEKEDFALAAEILRPAQEKFSDDPDMAFALAEALSSSDAEAAAVLLQKTLSINPKYIPALLRIAERHVDSEAYEDARSVIASIQEFNPAHPKSHALLAVIHHLDSNEDAERKSREAALQVSATNPEIDHYIGKRLSRKYRFQEGAAYQRRALEKQAGYLPAKIQLAQDLLRLGEDAAGWKLADEAQKADKYSTMLFNLMQLKDSIDQFETWTTDRFIIRMTKLEAKVYGRRVESLLNAAYDHLTEKYGYTPEEPIVVEIFDRPDDFAVRTFGIPDVAGFLGVCFGKLITANSPASMRQSPSNWESVLWHEFCHVITLQMTGNRIPRWLSEGISVYEERQKDARWGQSMTPDSRLRIQAGAVTPVSELSSAFLQAKSGGDLNFAYYESSMLVEYLVEEYGFETLVAVLHDLNEGVGINDSLGRHTDGIEQLDDGFESWLSALADEYAPKVAFDDAQLRRVTVNDDSSNEVPSNEAGDDVDERVQYSDELRKAVALIRDDHADEAVSLLTDLLDIYPEDSSPQGVRVLLARAYELLNDSQRQKAVLQDHIERCAEDFQSTRKLLSLLIADENWESAMSVASLGMAIDPLQPALLRDQFAVAKSVQDIDAQLQSLEALLELEPGDAARTNFLIASLLADTDSAKARRHALLSLEQAPRYREAHRLLLELKSRPADSTSEPVNR